VLAELDLRGRRRSRTVMVFHQGEGTSAVSLDARAVPIESAAEAVLAALAEPPATVAEAGGRG
jgi:hypothetical protein